MPGITTATGAPPEVVVVELPEAAVVPPYGNRKPGVIGYCVKRLLRPAGNAGGKFAALDAKAGATGSAVKSGAATSYSVSKTGGGGAASAMF